MIITLFGDQIFSPPVSSLEPEAINKGGRVLVHCREGVSRPQLTSVVGTLQNALRGM